MGAQNEINRKERFEFGENWANFLSVLNDERINFARQTLADLLKSTTLENKTFLDIGSGSGLFSLAARQMGATVFSFDYDPKSVACTKELKRRYFNDDEKWSIKEGNILDNDWITTLGQWDIIYTWGVLHHTGAMWQALDNVDKLVKPGGLLVVSIYNDQGGNSRRWHSIKRRYNQGNKCIKNFYIFFIGTYYNSRHIATGLLRHRDPFHAWKERKRNRGMSIKHDLIDWVGGYPFEVAKPEKIFDFYFQKGYQLTKLFTSGGIGCNEYVFKKTPQV